MKGTSTLLLLLSLVLFSWISGGESSSLASSSTPICSTSCFGQKEGSCFTTNDGYCCDCFSGCGGPIPHGLLPKSMDLEAHFSSYFPNLLITVGHKIQVTVSVPSLAQDQISDSLRLTSRIRFGDHSTSWGTKCDFPNDPNWSIASTVEESGSVMDIYSNSFDIDKFKGCGLTQGDDSQQYFSTIYVEKNLIFSEGKYNFHRKYFAEKSFNVTIPSFHATVTGGPVLSRKRATASPNDYVAIIGSVEYTGGKWFITLTTQTDSTWLFARIASDAPNALALSTTYGRNLQRFQLPSPTPCTNCQQSTIYTLDGCDAIDGSKPITDRFQLCNNELCTAPTDPFDVVMTVSTSSACTVAKTLPITRSLKIYTNEERTNEYIYASSPSFATTDMIFFRLSITKPPSFNCPTGSVPDYKITNICAYGPPSTQTADASDPGTLCSEIDASTSHRLGLADYVPKAVSFDGTGGACSDATTIVYDFKVKGDVLKSKAGNTVNNFRVQADAPLDYVVGSSKRNEKEFHQSGSVAMIKVLDVIQETPINQEVVKKNLPQNLKEEETDDSSSNHLWVPLLLIAIALITSF